MCSFYNRDANIGPRIKEHYSEVYMILAVRRDQRLTLMTRVRSFVSEAGRCVINRDVLYTQNGLRVIGTDKGCTSIVMTSSKIAAEEMEDYGRSEIIAL